MKTPLVRISGLVGPRGPTREQKLEHTNWLEERKSLGRIPSIPRRGENRVGDVSERAAEVGRNASRHALKEEGSESLGPIELATLGAEVCGKEVAEQIRCSSVDLFHYAQILALGSRGLDGAAPWITEASKETTDFWGKIYPRPAIQNWYLDPTQQKRMWENIERPLIERLRKGELPQEGRKEAIAEKLAHYYEENPTEVVGKFETGLRFNELSLLEETIDQPESSCQTIKNPSARINVGSSNEGFFVRESPKYYTKMKNYYALEPGDLRVSEVVKALFAVCADHVGKIPIQLRDHSRLERLSSIIQREDERSAKVEQLLDQYLDTNPWDSAFRKLNKIYWSKHGESLDPSAGLHRMMQSIVEGSASEGDVRSKLIHEVSGFCRKIGFSEEEVTMVRDEIDPEGVIRAYRLWQRREDELAKIGEIETSWKKAMYEIGYLRDVGTPRQYLIAALALQTEEGQALAQAVEAEMKGMYREAARAFLAPAVVATRDVSENTRLISGVLARLSPKALLSLGVHTFLVKHPADELDVSKIRALERWGVYQLIDGLQKISEGDQAGFLHNVTTGHGNVYSVIGLDTVAAIASYQEVIRNLIGKEDKSPERAYAHVVLHELGHAYACMWYDRVKREYSPDSEYLSEAEIKAFEGFAVELSIYMLGKMYPELGISEGVLNLDEGKRALFQEIEENLLIQPDESIVTEQLIERASSDEEGHLGSEAVLQQRIASLEKINEELIQKMRSMQQGAGERQGNRVEEIERLRAELEEAQALAGRAEAVQQENEMLKERLSAVGKLVEATQALGNEKTRLEMENRGLRGEIGSGKEEIAKLQAELEKARQSLSEAPKSEKITELEQAVEALREELNAAQQARLEAEGRASRLQRVVEEMRSTIEESGPQQVSGEEPEEKIVDVEEEKRRFLAEVFERISRASHPSQVEKAIEVVADANDRDKGWLTDLVLRSRFEGSQEYERYSGIVRQIRVLEGREEPWVRVKIKY